MYANPMYQVNSSILIKDNSSSLTSSIDQIMSELSSFKRIKKKEIQNEIGKLSSYSISYKTIQQLPFRVSYYSIGRIRSPERYQNCPFEVVLNSDTIQLFEHPVYLKIIDGDRYEIRINQTVDIHEVLKFGERYKTNIFDFTINKTKPYDKENEMFSYEYFFLIHDLNTLTNHYKKHLSIEQFDEKSSILSISISEEVPQKGSDYLNELMETYIQSELSKKNLIATNTINFIDNQLKNISDSLNVNANHLQVFRSQNKILDFKQKGNLIFDKLNKLSTKKTELFVQEKYFSYILDYLKSKDDLSSITSPSVAGINDQGLNKLVDKLLENFTEYQLLKYSSKKENPSIALAKNSLKKTKEALLENIENLKSSNSIEMRVIDNQIDEINKEIKKLPFTEKELLNIQRNFDLNNNIFTYLLEKRAEAGIAKASNVSEAEIIDYALPQNATLISPKKNLNYIIGFIIGFLIPLIIVLLRDYFNDKIIDKKDIENATKIPIIGVIGHSDEKTDLIVQKKSKSSIAETFRTIRTNIHFYNIDKKQNGGQIISINSTISGEGKTFVATNLSAIFAMGGKKTVLLGLDLRKPKLHTIFNVDKSIGISTYLIGNNTFEEIIYPTDVDNLFIIPSGEIPPNPAELIESNKMMNLIQKLRENFDYIILDTPPLAFVADSLLLNNFADITLFIIRQNFSTHSVLEFINTHLVQKNIKSPGILVNDLKTSGYYGYKKSYFKKYGSHYAYGYGYGYGYGSGYYDDDPPEKRGFFKRIFKKS